jgi:hypothetical protein
VAKVAETEVRRPKRKAWGEAMAETKRRLLEKEQLEQELREEEREREREDAAMAGLVEN